MIHWWGARPAVNKTPIAETDVRVGGRFKVQFWGQDGEHHSVSGHYREVVPNRRLVFTWTWQSTPERESQVSLDLKPVEQDTLLTLTHENFINEKVRDDHVNGWGYALDMLERALTEQVHA
ncbi:MAG TPA: SRPBCC family protein [Reyranella sp.]|nr:SRPBCC family protein [Reyranella sp.]